MNCKFCGLSTDKFHITLYGIHICEKCHLLLKKHNIKNDLDGLEKSVQEYHEYLKNIAPKKIRKYENYYMRNGSYTYRIPRHLFEERIVSKTEEAIKRSNSFYRLICIFAPALCRKFLHRETRKIVEKELVECEDELKRMKLEHAKEQKKLTEIRAAGYIERKLFAKYQIKYRRIVEVIKKEGILLYEYYLDEYPPDWDYRAKAIKERDNNTCQKCGSKANLRVHHKIPVKRPDSLVFTRHYFTEKRLGNARLRKGDHFPDNLITLCNQCHLKEHPEILESIENKKDRLAFTHD